jgi:hypothetical protein
MVVRVGLLSMIRSIGGVRDCFTTTLVLDFMEDFFRRYTTRAIPDAAGMEFATLYRGNMAGVL